MSFTISAERFATQKKSHEASFEVETTTHVKFSGVLELKQRHIEKRSRVSFWMNALAIKGRNRIHHLCFCNRKKNQMIDLQELFKRYCNALPDFGLNSSKYNIKLSYLCSLTSLVNRRHSEWTVINEAVNYVSFKIGIFR